VAAPPNSLSAHHGRSKAAGDLKQFVQAFFELLAGDIVGIPAKLDVAPRGVRGIRLRPAAPAERSYPMVGDAILGKRTVQRRLRVLRLSSRTWKAPHIRDSLDLVVFEQRQKRLQRTRRMAYRPDRRVHRRVDLIPTGQAFGRAFGRAYSVNLVQHRPLMHGDVVGRVALDLVLRLIFAGMVHMAFVLHIARVDLDDAAGHMASLGIPANMVADFEAFAHAIRLHSNPNRDSILAAPENADTSTVAPSAHTNRLYDGIGRFFGLSNASFHSLSICTEWRAVYSRNSWHSLTGF